MNSHSAVERETKAQGVLKKPLDSPQPQAGGSPISTDHTHYSTLRKILFPGDLEGENGHKETNSFPLAKNMRRVFLATLCTPAPYPSTSWCRDVSCCSRSCRQGETRRPFFGGIFANFKLVCAFRGSHWPYWRKRKTQKRKKKKDGVMSGTW